MKKTPLMLCGRKMKEVDNYTYLGDVIGGERYGASVHFTIEKKIWKGYACCF